MTNVVTWAKWKRYGSGHVPLRLNNEDPEILNAVVQTASGGKRRTGMRYYSRPQSVTSWTPMA